ncbi:diguanylate cyclase [Shewanella mesophila]|uniref:sensor domain-containing diguanylate cyclase n=1 Tax=Shewanella mesophila TaxID=2864208 RepID=UPI001C6615B1|nr:diguanylate cyclase [Shewanella mesophila]QYJ84942.1 diguanylate cyclase [Shewanella mesophila]
MQLINIRHLAFAFALGILGLLVNLVPIQLFGNQQLVIGNMFFVIVAVFIGPWYALLTALLCATGLYIAWDSWHMFFLFPLEALWLGYARRKEFYSLYADIVYWIVVGIPLFYIYLNSLSELPNSYLTFIILKQGINGLLYTALASIIVTLIPVRFHIKDKITNQKRKSFNQQLTYTFTQILTLVLLVSALIFNNHSLNQQQLAVKHRLEDSANHLGNAAQTIIDDHFRTIDNAARWLSFSGSDQSQWQGLLSKLHQSYPNFISMLITDDQGVITAASPIARLKESDRNNKTLSVMDRHYFQEAFFNQLTFISPAFLGRGFGNDPIVAISAPLYHANNQIKPIGILEGSLNLTQFAQIDHRDMDYETRSIILIDENNLVIYASKPLKMQPLEPLSFSMSGLNYKTKLNMINFNNLDSESPEYAYSKYILNNGWSLYVVVPFAPLLAEVEQQYLMMFTVLLFAFITTILLIQVISGRLTAPLEVIATKFSSWNVNGGELLLNDTTPKEIHTLSTSIQKSKQELLSYQLELEEKVALRTVELEKANTQLQALSEMDALTGLYNRRYTETHFPTLHDMCKRNGSALAFCIVDIDHFKQVNDTYGHQAGDKALITIATLMKQFFKRDTDIVSRYGGEEFLIILPQCNALQVEIHLNQFRQLIADTEIEMSPTQKAKLTVSMGTVVSNAGEFNNIDHWFKMADLNLYEAKESGRDKVICSLLAEGEY